MHTKMQTKGVLLSQTNLLQGIVWRSRRDLNPRFPSNISNLAPKHVRTIAYRFNLYYSLHGNGNDSTERREWESFSERTG